MGALAAIIGSGCCCEGSIDPCDCELTAIEVTWTGVFHCQWTCEECGLGTDGTVSGELNITELTATLTKPTPTACYFSGYVDSFSDLLVRCDTAEVTGNRLRIRASFTAAWTSATGWRVAIDLRWHIVVGMSSAPGGISVPNAHWCNLGAAPDGFLLYDADSTGVTCPTETSYSPSDDATICSLWTAEGGPTCSGITVGFPSVFAPGIVAFDYGSVTVS